MSASVAATFNAMDANHDGVITEAEFAAATTAPVVTAPVVYSSDTLTAAPVYYTVAPAIYVNADGTTTDAEGSPVTYEAPEVAPVTYTTEAAPVTYTTEAAPVTYTTAAPVTYTYAAAPADTGAYMPGERIVYQSVSTGKSYPGSVVDMYTDGGCQIILDVDGGVKDLFLQDMVRLTRENGAAPAEPDASPATAAAAAVTKKAKKVKSAKKGCC